MKQTKYFVWLLVANLLGCSSNYFKLDYDSTSNSISNVNPVDLYGFNHECRGSIVKYCNPQILFKFDSTELTSETRENLEWVVHKSQNNSIKKIKIEAHCDLIGTEKYNMKLSKRRAESIRKKLIDAGVSPEKIEIAFYGESQPLTLDMKNQAINRRAVITFSR